MTILAVVLVPETNHRTLLQRRAKKLRKETGDERWHAQSPIQESPMQLILNSLYRPLKVATSTYLSHCLASRLESDRTVACLVYSSNIYPDSSANGIALGYPYLLFTTYTHPCIFLNRVFPKYLELFTAGLRESLVSPL